MNERIFECWWCGEAIVELPCVTCGNKRSNAPKPDWDKIEEVFGDEGMPSCGMTDSARLGGSDENNQSSGTIYLGGK